ncbi:hypothetical protein QMG83_15110 [Salinibacterium sp. G-O1]|uniref:hypothetical protein n=1 Tax=Salinibacterium sp. G-O1 TaxID=3046208 RepID=UPI0024BA6046|nr:hypothetical protein [Salinibacterium sp. G-O1]MDJ0336556.1 hypothetical protein [Salinibacterium sp. G-O1]
MAVNEQHRQLHVAVELAEQARTLAHSTRTVPSPPDSYDLLAELVGTLDSLQLVCQQLAAWHTDTVDGKHYQGEDSTGDGATGTVAAAAKLDQAADAIATASAAVSAAHTANGVVRWFDTPR